MNTLKIVVITFIFGVAGFFGSEIGQHFSIPGTGNLIPAAEAVVGRPLTPVSVAGVARRTVRRCAVGVYNCKLSEPESLNCAEAGRRYLQSSAKPKKTPSINKRYIKLYT